MGNPSTSRGIGGAIGGIGGALGGKLVTAALGKVLPEVVTNILGGATGGAAGGAATSAVSYGMECSETSAGCSWSGLGQAALSGAAAGKAFRARRNPPTEASPAKPAPSECHSFTANTLVLMADGSTKPIASIKAGDKITNSVSGDHKTEAHTVGKVIITPDDHDFVTLTVAAISNRGPPGSTGNVTTTKHHPFYVTNRSTFVDAGDLHPGDRLQQPDGQAAVVLAVRQFQNTNTTTYDLTIPALHTYYILAGATPVLVHNCGTTTVYRKQDTSIPATQRLSVDESGNVTHSGSGNLYLNMTGDIAHSRTFKGDQIIAFEVPTSYVEGIASSSLPQRMPAGWNGSKRDWNRARKIAPEQSDAPGLFGLRDHHIPDLLDAVIPGSGRVVD